MCPVEQMFAQGWVSMNSVSLEYLLGHQLLSPRPFSHLPHLPMPLLCMTRALTSSKIIVFMKNSHSMRAACPLNCVCECVCTSVC